MRTIVLCTILLFSLAGCVSGPHYRADHENCAQGAIDAAPRVGAQSLRLWMVTPIHEDGTPPDDAVVLFGPVRGDEQGIFALYGTHRTPEGTCEAVAFLGSHFQVFPKNVQVPDEPPTQEEVLSSILVKDIARSRAKTEGVDLNDLTETLSKCGEHLIISGGIYSDLSHTEDGPQQELRVFQGLFTRTFVFSKGERVLSVLPFMQFTQNK